MEIVKKKYNIFPICENEMVRLVSCEILSQFIIIKYSNLCCRCNFRTPIRSALHFDWGTRYNRGNEI